MKRVIVKNKAGVQTHGAEMADPTEWIAEQKAANSWGKPERELTEDQVLAEGYSLTDAIGSREVESMGETRKLYRLAAEWTVEIQDLTAEIEERNRIKREEELNEAIRKTAKKRVLEADLGKILDPATRAAIADIRVILSKWT